MNHPESSGPLTAGDASKSIDLASSGRDRRVDCLRGIAILAVILCHYVGQRLPVTSFAQSPLYWICLYCFKSLSAGVDLFFVLSGYLIGGILIQHRACVNYFQVFYLRRIWRILPAYGLVLLVMAGLALLRMHGGAGLAWLVDGNHSWWSYCLFVQNFAMLAKGSFGSEGLAVTWSLAIEEQFYLLVPLIIRYLPPQRLLWFCISMIIAAPAFRIGCGLLGRNIGGYVMMPSRMDALFWGVAAACVLKDERWRARIVKQRKKLTSIGLSLVALEVLLVLAENYSGHRGLRAVAGLSFLAFGFFCILVTTMVDRPSTSGSWLSSQFLCALGLGCFSLYLFHQIVIGTVGWLCFQDAGFHYDSPLKAMAGAFSLLLTFVVAWVVWVCVERPGISRGKQWRYRSPST